MFLFSFLFVSKNIDDVALAKRWTHSFEWYDDLGSNWAVDRYSEWYFSSSFHSSCGKIIWHKNINIHTWSTFNDSLNRYICLGYIFTYKWIMLFISALEKKSNLLEMHRLIVIRNNIRDTSNFLKRYSGLVYLLSFSSIATSRIGKRAFIKIIDLHSYSVMTN